MENQAKKLQKLRKLEGELVGASPAKAAKLTSRIVRMKATFFDEEKRG